VGVIESGWVCGVGGGVGVFSCGRVGICLVGLKMYSWWGGCGWGSGGSFKGVWRRCGGIFMKKAASDYSRSCREGT